MRAEQGKVAGGCKGQQGVDPVPWGCQGRFVSRVCLPMMTAQCVGRREGEELLEFCLLANIYVQSAVVYKGPWTLPSENL